MPQNVFSLQDVVDHILGWIRTQLDKASLDGLVVGVSGGVDSALVSTLCALTGKPVFALSMPIHQKTEEVARADRHLKWLQQTHSNLSPLTLNLTESFETLKKALPKEVGQDGHAMANSRSRLRMLTLYAVAGAKRALVCGTGNRVEDFGIGFFTKYGDGGVDISPIASLMKTEVCLLAAHLGVSEEILSAAPTDGLWEDGRLDEDQIGASYPQIEWAMEFDGDRDSLDARQREILDLYTRWNRMNAHKVEPIPVCQIPEQLRSALHA